MSYLLLMLPFELMFEQAMGGEGSPTTELFRRACVEFYNKLRKRANLIVTLLMYLVDAQLTSQQDRAQLHEGFAKRFAVGEADDAAGKRFLKDLRQMTTFAPRFRKTLTDLIHGTGQVARGVTESMAARGGQKH